MEQKNIGIRFSENDEEMLELIKEQFPDCLIIRSDELEGAEVFYVAIIPTLGIALQLLDFILNHIVPKKDEKQDKKKSKRKLVSDGKTISGTELADMDKRQVKKKLSLKFNIDFSIGVEDDVET